MVFLAYNQSMESGNNFSETPVALKGSEVNMDENPYNPLEHPVLIVISGPSGVGKDTVVRNILQKRDDFHFVITATDRPARADEIDGVDYFFLTTENFERMIEAGEFLEHAVVHDCYKGVPKWQIREALNSGRDVIMRVDPQGAATLRRLIPEATFIFLLAESEKELSERLKARNSETSVSFDLRMEITKEELKRIDEFDYCVVNRSGRVQEAVEQILAIVTAERCRVGRPPIIL